MKKLVVLAVLLATGLPASASIGRLLATQDAWPVWSPDGHTIAFTRIHQGRNLMELMTVDTRTHRVAKVAQNAFQLLPSWAPDGTHLAYQAGGDVYVTDLHGVKRRVAKGGAPAYGDVIARTQGLKLLVDGTVWASAVIGQPAWSPDRKTLAFRRDTGIFTIDAPGTARQLVGAANPGDPSWSPDGAQVAFAIGDEVWVASRGLVPAHAIAREKPGAGKPSWSPDGSAVVYSWRGGVTMTTLAGRSTRLAGSGGLGAAFSPQAPVVAYAGPRADCPAHMAIRTQVTLTGSCEVRGTTAADVIEGTSSWGDAILAGSGNDLVHANDRHTDRVDCGPGRDTVWADRSDRLRRCEVVHR